METGKPGVATPVLTRPTRPKTAALRRAPPSRNDELVKERAESRNADVGVQVEHGQDVSHKATPKLEMQYDIHATMDQKRKPQRCPQGP